MAKLIPYGKQFIDKTDKRLVIESLSNDLITTGPLVEKFEIGWGKVSAVIFTHKIDGLTESDFILASKFDQI